MFLWEYLLPCHCIAGLGDSIGDCRYNESLMQPQGKYVLLQAVFEGLYMNKIFEAKNWVNFLST